MENPQKDKRSAIDKAQVRLLLAGLDEQRRRIVSEQAEEARAALQQPQAWRGRFTQAERQRLQSTDRWPITGGGQ